MTPRLELCRRPPRLRSDFDISHLVKSFTGVPNFAEIFPDVSHYVKSFAGGNNVIDSFTDVPNRR